VVSFCPSGPQLSPRIIEVDLVHGNREKYFKKALFRDLKIGVLPLISTFIGPFRTNIPGIATCSTYGASCGSYK
jgi:hypothetical protein